MSMKKELFVGGAVFLLVFLLLSGCAEQTATKEKTEPVLSENVRPVIEECRAEYFDRNDSATIYFYSLASDPDGTVVQYSWNLSDGSTSNEQSFIHTFIIPGTYQVHLTVMDDKGLTNTTSIAVHVNMTP
jgi:chitodextrinase